MYFDKEFIDERRPLLQRSDSEDNDTVKDSQNRTFTKLFLILFILMKVIDLWAEP